MLNPKEEANGVQTLGVNLESVSLQLGLIGVWGRQSYLEVNTILNAPVAIEQPCGEANEVPDDGENSLPASAISSFYKRLMHSHTAVSSGGYYCRSLSPLTLVSHATEGNKRHCKCLLVSRHRTYGCEAESWCVTRWWKANHHRWLDPCRI